MRTPKETLERLAEVAPKEWEIQTDNSGASFILNIDDVLAWSDEDDIGNGAFTAFLKEKLVEMGLFWTSCCHGDELYDCTVTKDRVVAKSGYVPTEWQAVAEAMIGVLESA
jgi:hypothetical protein